MPIFHWTLSLGDVLIASAILSLIRQLGKFAKALYVPIHRYLYEHDTMWVDYVGRKGPTYLERKDGARYSRSAVAYRECQKQESSPRKEKDPND